MTRIVLSPNHPGLQRISIMQHDGWLDITAKQLPLTLRKQLNYFYGIISGTGEEMPEDLVVFKVAYNEDKSFKSMYAPSIYSNVDGLPVVVWGGIQYPLTVEMLEILDVEYEKVTLYRFEEKCLVFNLDTEDEFLSLPLILRTTKETRDTEDRVFKKVLKAKDLTALGQLLFVKENKDPLQSSFEPTAKFTELPELTKIVVYEAELKEFATHENYILRVGVEDSQDLVKVWSPGDLKSALLAGAKIQPGITSFTYVNKESVKGKIRSFVTILDLTWDESDVEMLQLV